MSTSTLNPGAVNAFGGSYIASSLRTGSRLDDLAAPDLSWVANTSSRYAAFLKKIPAIFAWEPSAGDFAVLQVLGRSVTLQRFRSCLNHIARYDSNLARSMEACFNELPDEGKNRLLTAPETFRRISLLGTQPVESIAYLCTALNGEAAYYGLAAPIAGYVTALGDYYTDVKKSQDAEGDGSSVNITIAPRLAGFIPIDFNSPNIDNDIDLKLAMEGRYSSEEQEIILNRLEATLERVRQVNANAASLICSFVKVIVPTKQASGSGSTSQPHIPGRVLLRGLERASLETIASMLVHESMHQLLYIFEWAGPFVIPDPQIKEVRLQSKWTGRSLPLHSYIHACFIWYGLSTFWASALKTNAFNPTSAQRQLTKSALGFSDRNPTELLAPYAGMLRYDVVRVAESLQSHLNLVMPSVEAP